MNITDFNTVQTLHQERVKLTHKLGILGATAHGLCNNFNVHFHGSPEPYEVAEFAAQALRGYFRGKLAEIDAKLGELGVRLEHDRLASLRPESLGVAPVGAPAPTGVLSTNEAGDGPEVMAAVMLLVKTAVDTAGLGRTWDLKDLSTEHEGKRIPLGSYKVTVQKTG